MKHMSVNQSEFQVFDQGQGTPILFVHGFPLNHSMWQAQLDWFFKSHRVIAPDLRGFGGGTVSEAPVTMEQFADDLNAILNELSVQEPVVFCGLSMGGYIAWQFWKKYPQRTQALVLCDTKAAADTPEAAEGREKTAQDVLQNGPEALARTMPAKLLSSETREQKPQVVEQLQRMIRETDPAGIAAALRGMALRPDVTSMLPEINIPALVIVGEDDQISTVDEMRQMADAIPESEFLDVPQAGHMSPMENPDVFNQGLQSFLEKRNR